MPGRRTGSEQEVHAALTDARTDDGPGMEVGELHDLVRDFLAQHTDGPYGVEVDAHVTEGVAGGGDPGRHRIQ